MVEEKDINFEMQYLGDFTEIVEEGSDEEIRQLFAIPNVTNH